MAIILLAPAHRPGIIIFRSFFGLRQTQKLICLNPSRYNYQRFFKKNYLFNQTLSHLEKGQAKKNKTKNGQISKIYYQLKTHCAETEGSAGLYKMCQGKNQ